MEDTLADVERGFVMGAWFAPYAEIIELITAYLHYTVPNNTNSRMLSTSNNRKSI